MAFWNRRSSEIRELRSQVSELSDKRALGGFPWVDDNPAIPFSMGGPAHPSRAGYQSVDQALRLAPVYASARLLADGVASLPIQVYLPDRNGDTQKYKGPTIFNQTPDQGPLGQGPSVTGTVYDWIHTCMTSLVLEGNAFGFIATRDGFGFPTTIEWMAPQLVWIDENDNEGLPSPLKAQYYYQGRHIPREDMFHVRAFTVAGRTRGISPLKAFTTLVRQGASMLEYGTTWFDNGGFPPGVFKNTMMEVDPDNSAEIKSRLVAAIRRRQPLVIGADWDYQHIAVPPSESQFIEGMQLNATQIAAIYGVPPYRVGGQAPSGTIRYANVEAEQIGFITDTLRPWLVRLECAFYGLLPGNRYARFNADAMIKTDVKTRHEVYQIDRQMGLRPIDEMRRLDDLEPLPSKIGEDNIPLLLSSDLARSGKAVPLDIKDQIYVLEVPPGATPGVAATQTTETPQTDEVSQGGTPDQPGKSNAPGAAAKPQAGAKPPNGKPPAPRKPATAPAPSGTPRSSVHDVAVEWAGAAAGDPVRFRSFLAETGAQARRHGISFAGYTDKIMDERQAGWLLGFLGALGDPQPSGVNHANGRVSSRK